MVDQVTKIQWKLDGIELSGHNTMQELTNISKIVETLPTFKIQMNKIVSTLDDMAAGEQ